MFVTSVYHLPFNKHFSVYKSFLIYSHENDTFSPLDLVSLNLWYNVFLSFVSCLLDFLFFLKSFRYWFEAPSIISFLFWVHWLTNDLSMFLLNASLIEGIPDSICSINFFFFKKIVLFSFLFVFFFRLL